MKKLYYIKKSILTQENEGDRFSSSVEFNEDEPMVIFNSKESAAKELDNVLKEFLKHFVENERIDEEQLQDSLDNFVYVTPSDGEKVIVYVDLNSLNTSWNSYKYLANIKEIILDIDN